jgi:MFS family permease
MLAGGWMADRLASKSSRGRVFTQAGGLCLAAPFLALCGIATEAWVLYVALAAYGVGRGIYDCNIMPVLCEVVDEEERSIGYGFLNFAGTLAGGLIAYAAGLLKATVGIGGVLSCVGVTLLCSSMMLFAVPKRPA